MKFCQIDSLPMSWHQINYKRLNLLYQTKRNPRRKLFGLHLYQSINHGWVTTKKISKQIKKSKYSENPYICSFLEEYWSMKRIKTNQKSCIQTRYTHFIYNIRNGLSYFKWSQFSLGFCPISFKISRVMITQ